MAKGQRSEECGFVALGINGVNMGRFKVLGTNGQWLAYLEEFRDLTARSLVNGQESLPLKGLLWYCSSMGWNELRARAVAFLP
ncbi:hypothetical protein E6C27_scaffold119G00390 [Cucumis melo var. makuwa]|uniref:Uncharacterized protein n=1 Tax=Cucumis melo var. makuwa TaxID=1194695 RepID=A0A5A7T4R5_CUCMM|nr:hypothetical protein E6C27_scaffold119G00390 [Cucumis melo var. makuwa]